MERKFMPASAWNSNPLTFWRERILFMMCLTAAVLGPLALIPSILIAFYEKLWLVVLLDTAVYVILTFLLFHGDWPIKLRGGIICFILYLLGVALIVILGPAGIGYIWLFAASVMASALLGITGGLWMMLIHTLTLISLTVYFFFGSPHWMTSMENALGRWIVLAFIFLVFNAFITVVIAFMLNGLKEALIKEQEISNRLRRSEERYRDAHERFLTVLNSMDAFIYVVDMKTHEILFTNKYFVEYLGKEPTGGVCWRELKGETVPCAHCTMASLLDADGEPGEVYVWEEHNATLQKWYINYDRAIRWIDGRMARIQISTDVTALKKLERDLRQSQKMEAVGTLAGGIAHDFNNILYSIIGYTELAIDDVERGTLLEKNLQEVLIAGNRAKELVRHILAFARQSDQEIKPIQVNQIVLEGLDLIRSAIPASIDIHTQIESDSYIMGNATEVHQIVMNLCTNASHAMKDKTGTLRVSLVDEAVKRKKSLFQCELEPGRYLKLSVADTGSGIDPRHLPSIFEPYFTTKPQGEGTGIGLAMVHGIIENYGGKITVSSKLGKGTCFDIYLPVAQAVVLPETESPNAIPGGTERILFVDDELTIVRMAKQSLSRLGYKVSTRTSSIDALELFQHKFDQFDLVITDYAMPNKTGEDLALAMLKIRPDIPIILCTGYSKEMSMEQASRLGIKGFIHKPIIQKEMANIIRRVLESGRRSGKNGYNFTERRSLPLQPR